MTASNGGIPSDEVKNYFNSVQSPFPLPIDGKIETVQFLEAAKGVITLIDQFGSIFAPVKFDMNGNIEKLSQVYNMDQINHSSLNDMILLEKSAGGILATDALLWLRRIVIMVSNYQKNTDRAAISEEAFERAIEDVRNGNRSIRQATDYQGLKKSMLFKRLMKIPEDDIIIDTPIITGSSK